MFGRPWKLPARFPRATDALVAGLWTGLSVLSALADGDEAPALEVVLPACLLMGVVLYWRRTRPMMVFLAHAATVLVLTIVDIDAEIPVALLAGVYSFAAWSTERWRSVQLFAGFIILAVAIVGVGDRQYFDDALSVALMLAISFLLGDTMRSRRAYRQSLIDRAERAEALRDSLAQQAVAEERTRIARELHDVVAHSMSLMVVQAGAARRVIDSSPEAAAEALGSIEGIGRNSLGEMRRLLDVLRNDDEGAERAPQPDLGRLGALADEFSRSGLDVAITEDGTAPDDLPSSVTLSAYRIVQESLTNSLKHAGGSQAQVQLAWHPGELQIVVDDDGPVAGTTLNGDTSLGARGIIGMRERVATFDGEFSAGPRLGGGWRVRATLPLPSTQREIS